MSEVPKFYIKAYSYAEALTPPTRRQGDADYWTPSPNNSSNLFYNLGNIGIGIANPQQKLHIDGKTYFSGNVGIGVTNPTSTLDVNGTITTSNLVVLNAYSTNYQIAPVRGVFYIDSGSSNQFILNQNGYFGGYASNALVYVDNRKLSYYSDTINDYTLSTSYNNITNATVYTISLTQPATFGKIVDITVWPQILQESLPNPMRVYQRVDVQSDFISTGSSIYYMAGTVGIGTTVPTQALHVVGNILTTGTLTASNINVIGDFVTMNTVTSNTEQLIVTNAGTGPALKVTQTGDQSIAEFYDNESGIALFVGNQGNIGIGTTVPRQLLDVQGGNAIISGNVGIGTANPRGILGLGANGAYFPSPIGNPPLYAARAWVAFTGTTGEILAQGNIASVTRNTAGAYNIAFTTPMPNTSYAVIVSSSKTDTNYNTTSGWLLYGGSVSRTVNGFNAITWYPASTWLSDTAYGTYIVVYC